MNNVDLIQFDLQTRGSKLSSYSPAHYAAVLRHKLLLRNWQKTRKIC